jgi:hypothetical protein
MLTDMGVEVGMSSGKIIGYVAAGLLIVIGLGVTCGGIFYIWGSPAPDADQGWLTAGGISAFFGLLLLGGGIAILMLASRGKMTAANQNVTLKVDLPGNVNLDALKCKSCGGSLSMDNIQMVAGAPVVNCPYCNSTYQLTEEPKW